jgi:hypothetical protein
VNVAADFIAEICISFIKEIFVARKAFAAYLISSEASSEVITMEFLSNTKDDKDPS